MKTIYWLLFSHLKVYFEISKIKISHFPYECMLRDLSALWCSLYAAELIPLLSRNLSKVKLKLK